MADDQQFPYTPVPGRFKTLLEKVPSIGRPTKATQAWLKGLGYNSSNDRQTLAAMRRMGMIGSAGEPTAFYDAVRNKNESEVAGFVQSAYRELFDLYPDAYSKDATALQNFFRSKTTAGESVQRLMVRTFQTVCSFGEFDAEPETKGEEAEPKGTKRAAAKTSQRVAKQEVATQKGGAVTLNVNIQLQLPPSADGDVYDKLFEAMGKHLKGLASFE